LINVTGMLVAIVIGTLVEL